MNDRPVFLIGFMGSGKSTLGQQLADRLGWEFLDTDRLIEKREGLSVEQIFREQGEERFREIESELAASLAGRTKIVVATGGGLFLRAKNRSILKSCGSTVWIDVPFEICISRVGQGAGRPLWRPEDPLVFRAMFDRRAASYALAETRIRVASETADELVGRILAVFN